MEIQILVNGNRCKQYNFQGKTFVEAKNGSEYVVEIKNNHWKRVLAVGSVDGLNVLTGKTANENDSGYIVGAYSAEKIKGFRFSDDEWAMFKFGYKFYGNTYAQSKEDGSEKNCGVIGMRLFYEKEPVVIYNSPPVVWNNQPQWLCGTAVTGGLGSGTYYTSNVNYCVGSPISPGLKDTTKSVKSNSRSSDKISKKRTLSGPVTRCSADRISNYCNDNIPVASAGFFEESDNCLGFFEAPKQEFDMGTEWGRKEKSRVNTVAFDRGCLAQSFDIYYASRESLINMGVPLDNTLQVNLPQSFPTEYAQPPKNWRG